MNIPNFSFSRVFNSFFCLNSLKDLLAKKEEKLAFLLIIFLGATSLSNKEMGKGAMGMVGEKFGVVTDSYILRSIHATPDFSSLKKNSSSDEEEELKGLFWPTEMYVVTDTFGGTRNHKGLDIRGRDSSWNYCRVFSAERGVVSKVSRGKCYGKYVDVAHDGFKTRYAHLSRVLCSKGDTLEKGQILAACGNTGRSTGPHLHFEVYVTEGRKKIEFDPLSFFYEYEEDITYCISPLRKRRRNTTVASKEAVREIFENSEIGLAASAIGICSDDNPNDSSFESSEIDLEALEAMVIDICSDDNPNDSIQ